MLEYAENDCYCRSRFLLEYFADFSGQNCGHCDVCLDLKLPKSEAAATASSTAAVTDESLRACLSTALADGALHSAADMRLSGVPTERTARLLQQMVDNGEVEMVCGKFRRVK